MQTKQKYPSKINLILHFLSGSKRYFVLGMLFAGLVSLLDMVNPKIISFTVDSVSGTRSRISGGHLPVYFPDDECERGRDICAENER